MNSNLHGCVGLLVIMIGVNSATATVQPASPATTQSVMRADPKPAGPASWQDIGIDQKLGRQLPMNATFRDEHGRPVQLEHFFGHRRPVVLSLVNFECPSACTLVLNNLIGTMNMMTLILGKDFEVITISFDPTEGAALAAAKKRVCLKYYKRDPASADKGWHFLTGSQQEIDRITEAVGFRYGREPEGDQFIHPSVIVILSPDGHVERYFMGVSYQANDLHLTLVEASQFKVGSFTDRIMLWFYEFDATQGGYRLRKLHVIEAAGLFIAGGIASMLLVRSRRASSHPHNHAPDT